jgi:hypothetical protein
MQEEVIIMRKCYSCDKEMALDEPFRKYKPDIAGRVVLGIKHDGVRLFFHRRCFKRWYKIFRKKRIIVADHMLREYLDLRSK